MAVALAATLLFPSCSEDELVGADSSIQQTILAEMTNPAEERQSRTCVDVENSSESLIGLLWQVEDKLGVFSQDGNENALFTNTATENAPTTEFSGEISGTAQYAYFPYSSTNNDRSVTDLQGTLLAEQSFNSENGTLVCDYKIGKRADDGTNKFKFEQLFTLLNITLDATGTALEGENLVYIQLKVTDQNGKERPICGDFTFSAIDGTWKAGDNLSNTISMPWPTHPKLGKDKSCQGYITVMPVVKEGDKLSIDVFTESHKASFTADCKLELLKSCVYNIPLKLKDFIEKFNGKVETITQPKITSFGFKVADNTGKLLDNELKWSNRAPLFSSVSSLTAAIDDTNNEISLTIPYLYDFKLKPTFELQGATKVLVNGVEQVSGSTEVDFTRPVTYTLINEGSTRDYIVKITNTGLPVVVVKQSTSGNFDKTYKDKWQQIIGGTPYNKFVDFMIRGKDTEWVEDDQIQVYQADGTLDCETRGGVRLRGNTTQEYPKKPFAMKFTSKKSVLGMPAHKRWVLLANWLDHSMIRNSVAFDIAHAIENAWSANSSIEKGIPWNVHGQNVELVFIESNGEAHHVGNYFLCEQIKIDGNRLNINDSYEDVIKENASPNLADCGYLLEFDSKEDTDPCFTTSNGIKVKYKDDAIDGTSLATTVRTKIQGIEDKLDNGDYTAAYEDLDINTMVDQWLIWELTMNREYGDPGSVYMYMDGDGKLCAGPVWDFDRGTFQNTTNAASYGNTDRIKPYNEWMCWRTEETYIWYKQLIKDPIFQRTVQARWAVIKPELEKIVNKILNYGQTQAESYKYDSAMWPTDKADVQKWKDNFSDWSGDEQLGANGNYQEVINNFVTVYQERLDGINTLITSGKFTK